MVPGELERESNFDYSTMSVITESSSASSSLCYQNQGIKQKEAAEPRRRVKKLRSIKLGRLPSLRITTRRATASVLQPTRIELADEPPNYMRNTTSSDAKKENSQKSARSLTRRSSFKPAKSLTRLSSKSYRRSLMRKSSGGSEPKKKLKSRSIKLGRRSSIVVPDDADASTIHFRSNGGSDAGSSHFEASSHDSESNASSNDEDKRSLSDLSRNSVSGKKSVRVITRTPSMRNPRILRRLVSLRTKRTSLKSSSKMIDSSIQKATCSSALKDSKTADLLELQSAGIESEGISTMKVCPYSYCSLHGHRHSNVPQLKRFVSMRRRMVKTQKSRAKRSSNIEKGIRKRQIAGLRDAVDLEIAPKISAVTSIGQMAEMEVDSNGEGSLGGDGDTTHFETVAVNIPSPSHLRLQGQIHVSTFPIVESSGEDCNSSLNLDVLKVDSALNTSEANHSTSGEDDPFNKPENLRTNTFVESKKINSMASASAGELLEGQTADVEDIDEDSSADSDLDGKNEVEKTGMEKQKNMGLWHLIYQHMVTGIAETQPPLDKKNNEDQGDDEHTLSGTNKCGSCLDSLGVDQYIGVDDHDGSIPNIQLYERSAIKLVQEAFDKILSEIPDHSSDNQSIDSNITSDKELAEKNHDESRKLSTATCSDSGENSTVHDQEELSFMADKAKEPEGGRAESNMVSKSGQQTPNNWSNLKKILILRRFVKALEKVRNIKPRKPRYLPVLPDHEAEKIHLRHQITGERKNSEEWMLDYAIQQVISTLAPAQKRKVALLVQAFETVVPLPESGTTPRSDMAATSHATPIQTYTASSFQRDSDKGKETDFRISLSPTSHPYMCSKEEKIPHYDSSTEVEYIPESLSDSVSGSVHVSPSYLAPETTETGLKKNSRAPYLDVADHSPIVNNDTSDSTKNCSMELGVHNLNHQPFPKSADVKSTSDDEIPSNGQIPKEELASNHEISTSGEESDELKSQIRKKLQGSIEAGDAVTSVPVTKMVEESSKAAEVKAMLQIKFLQALASHEQSKPSCDAVADEKHKNMRLWYMIYKHMVSGTATVQDDATDKEKQRTDSKASYGEHDSFSHQGFPLTGQDIDIENHSTGSQKVDIQQIEAIRMVEEAIDEISLPDSQYDSSDDQSVTKDTIPDQKHLERQPDEGGYISISPSTRKSHGESNNKKAEQMIHDLKEPCLKSGEEETEENKTKLSTQKSWSNLKKVILLRRFVKAMEKVEKINPRKPRFLPLEPENEPEKVNLRHQGAEDRKNADEWMLDYALQQVVAKLTPVRKRKVKLLVEAFETVIPTIGS